MQKDMIKNGYEEAAKASAGFYKNFIDVSNTAMEQMRRNLWNTKDFAELAKTSMDFVTEMNKMGQDILNTQLQHQLKTMNLQTSAQAIKEFNDICTNTMRRLMESQVQEENIYVESGAEHLEKMKGARSPLDMITIMMHMFSDIQGKVKDNMVGTISLMEAVQVNMSAWAEKTIDKTAAAQEPAESNP